VGRELALQSRAQWQRLSGGMIVICGDGTSARAAVLHAPQHGRMAITMTTNTLIMVNARLIEPEPPNSTQAATTNQINSATAAL
jgi:hypothetical protein